MGATVIDGKAVAASVRERVRGEVEELTGELGRPPGLATVLVGDDPASAIYVRRKHEACEEVGIRSFHHEPDGSISQEELLELVGELNDNDEVDGILVQLPLPDHLDAGSGRRGARSRPRTSTASPRPARGCSPEGSPVWCPATPQGVMELIRSAGVEPSGKEAVIVGRSNLVGRPLFSLAAGRERDRDRLPQPHRATSARSAGAPRSWSPRPVSPGWSPATWSGPAPR